MDTEDLKSQVQRAQQGDLQAYGQIVRRFQDMAYGYGYAILGDFHLAEDAAQEAFIQAYRDLGKLDNPVAFGGWFRRIVFKHCDRITRRKKVRTTPLDAAAVTPAKGLGPADATQKREMQETVLAAIRALPENQRTTTTLFYINGYSQNDIAQFLEVPVTTVKKRLHDARTRLKERMINMVEETLHANAPDDRFSQQVVDELLARPRPLEIEGNPVKVVWDKIRTALPEYEVITGEEIVERSLFRSQAMQEQMDDFYDRMAFSTSDSKILRTHTHITAVSAIRGRTPPIRLLAPGRVFSNEGVPTGIGDAHGVRVFHMLDGVCIDRQVDLENLAAICETMLRAIFGTIGITWHEQDSGMRAVEAGGRAAEITIKDKSHPLSGCAMLKGELLQEFGYDPAQMAGGTFGMALDLAAMLKYDIDEIRKLWQPPHVPG